MLPRPTATPAVRGMMVSCGLALIAEPAVVARVALLVTIVMLPGVVALPIALRSAVQAYPPTHPRLGPSVPFRKMS